MDDDAESLFGSPPPTPTRGRSPSPALALPSFSGNIINFSSSSAQNVGTIALPGSHNFSELAVNPLALSLSHPTPQNGDALRPPAQLSGAFATQLRPHTPAAAPSVAPTHLGSAQAPLKRKTPTARKPKPPKPKAATPRPTPPPIHLPDPSDPLPPNLLRNQPGLLGTAGVVGGVRAAHLPAPTPPTETRTPSPNQGTTSADPIFVDEEPPRRSSFKRPLRFTGDVAALPPPSNRDIISTLIQQKEIFPLLETILKFISSAQSSPSPSRATSDAGSRSQTPESGSSKKKRKVRHVPAGAELWDVPFPFAEGEAPPAYQNDWERGRGKSLIADLVTLIKRAAKKAAITNFLDKRNMLTEAQRSALGKHYRVDTLFYGSDAEVLGDASNGSRSSAVPPLNPTPPLAPAASSFGVSMPSDTSSSSTAFDQLITSLLSASSTEQISWDTGSGLDGLMDTLETPSPLDTGLFNSWMDIFHAFPFPAEGFTPQTQLEDYHINPQQTFLTIPESLTPSSVLDTPSPFDFPADFSQTLPENYNPTTLDQLMMDPLLLAMSPPAPNMPTPIDTSMGNFSDSGCPSLASSPMPSVSSLSSFGPMTPTETGWSGDASIGVYSPGEEQRVVGMRAEARVQPIASTSAGAQPPAADVSTAGASKGKKRDFSSMAGWTDAERDALNFLEVLSKSKLGQVRPVEEDSQDDDAGKDPQDIEFSKVPTLPIVGSLVKADVLARARQRKEELAAEIAKTRVNLWETTVEGGVLAGLVKYYSTS
ncbi:hypothetical protein B0H16DRAFT_143440 [Mycena metata]|uniref:Uncharacterized protein n=1 Tax=Mycena metata TaxID=1033252 RepID=A0AAD7JYS6_9AGAR|nr:hypothetical protein B0H16DRAFT_143440 [Mycena metata]